MAVRQRRRDLGAALGRSLVSSVGQEFHRARTNANLSQAAVGNAAGLSRSQYGRIERADAPEVSIQVVARVAAALGLDTSLRFYPVADPVRDGAHRALLERVKARLHPSLRWETEVPFPRSGDLRAWDATASGFTGSRGRCGFEAETRPNDAQALDRKLALKVRDGDVAVVVLVLADTRHNRTFLRSGGRALKARFPADGARVLEPLAAGRMPEGNAIVLL